MEGQLASEDLGRDLISVNNLLKKHEVSETSAQTTVYTINTNKECGVKLFLATVYL